MERGTASILERLHALGQTVPTGWDEAEFAEALLRARARRLAVPRGEIRDETRTGIEALGVRLGSERYALPLAQLSEVIALSRWTPVPGQPAYLLGVANLRGEIRPVLDLHALLGLSAPEAEARSWTVFIKSGRGEVGLRVDGLDRVIRLDADALTHPRDAGNGLPHRYISGIAADALALLDTDQILALDALKDTRGTGRDDS